MSLLTPKSVKCVDFNSGKNKCLQLFNDDSKKGTEIVKATCTWCEHISRMQPLHLKPLLPRWKVFAQSPTAEKWCGMIFMRYPSHAFSGWPTEEHTRGSRGEIDFHLRAGPMLRALIVAYLSSELISGLAKRWRRKDNKYATRCYSSAWWREILELASVLVVNPEKRWRKKKLKFFFLWMFCCQIFAVIKLGRAVVCERWNAAIETSDVITRHAPGSYSEALWCRR